MRSAARKRAVGNVFDERPWRLQTRVTVTLHHVLYAETPDQVRQPPERRAGPAALLYVRDGDAYVVVASKGGSPRHPGWFHNLTAHPNVEIQVGRDRIRVRARVAEGQERSRLWKRADKVNQGLYTTYQSRTKRMIPVVVLEPR